MDVNGVGHEPAVNARWWPDIEYLLDVKVLVPFSEQPVGRWFSKYFAVPKKDGQSRAVFSGAALSDFFANDHFPVNLMPIPELIQKLRHLASPTFTIVTSDFVNAFYQIPYSEQVRSIFAMRISHGEKIKEVMFAVASMGFCLSPRVAQCLGFYALLREPDPVSTTVKGKTLTSSWDSNFHQRGLFYYIEEISSI